MKFWLKVGDQWQALAHLDVVLTAGIHTIAVQSPQPHFTITAHIRHFENARDRRQIWHQDRAVRTNDEGMGYILIDADLSPGFWEIRCTDADLIAELFGEGVADTLQFTVVSTSAASLASPSASMASPDFQLLRNTLSAQPGTTTFLAGRTSLSGTVVVVVTAAEGTPLIQLKQVVQLRPGAQSAAFTLHLPVPAIANGVLLGEAALFTSADAPLAVVPFQLEVTRAEALAAPELAAQVKPQAESKVLQAKPQPSSFTTSATFPNAIASLSLEAEPSSTFVKLRRFAGVGSRDLEAELALVPDPVPEQPLQESLSPQAEPVSVPPASAKPTPPALLTLQVPEFVSAGVSIPVSVSLAANLSPCVVCLMLVAGDRVLDGPRWLLQWEPVANGRAQSLTRIVIPQHQGRLSLEAIAIAWDALNDGEAPPLAATLHEWELD